MTDAPAFRLEKVRKVYRHFTLHDVDLSLPRGQIMGFVGPNGAGKSTTIRILMGLIGHDAGRVELLGRAMPEHRIWAKRRMGFMSEDMGLYSAATVGWHVAFVRSLYPSWEDAYASELLRRFRLIPEQKVKQLSHGQRVKLALLLALARRPELLILDEPTTGLDPVARREVLAELLAALEREEGAVFFSSHHTHDVEEISDRVTFIYEGRILDSAETRALLERWRRIRLRWVGGLAVSLPDESVWMTRQGDHGVIATGRYSEELVQRLAAAGASVEEVQPMALEEIFTTRLRLADGGGDP